MVPERFFRIGVMRGVAKDANVVFGDSLDVRRTGGRQIMFGADNRAGRGQRRCAKEQSPTARMADRGEN